MAPTPRSPSGTVCRHFADCGGCPWQDVAYPTQLLRKQVIVRDHLLEALGVDRVPNVEPTRAPLADPWEFRGKVHFVFGADARRGGLVMGHYRRGSQQVVPIDECPVHVGAGNAVAFAFRDALAAAGVPAATADLREGLVRHLVVRAARRSGRVLATLVVTRNDARLRPVVRRILAGIDSIEGFHVNVHPKPGSYLFGRDTIKVAGASHLREDVGSLRYLISPTSFFQTNIAAAQCLVDLVVDAVRGCGHVMDLYAGAGLFTLPIAQAGAHVVAVEENGSSVDDGVASRRLNRLGEGPCRFVRARAEDLASGGHRRSVGDSPEAVVMDPPRSGSTPAVLEWVSRTLRPRLVVYVSCEPEALSRDAVQLTGQGYALQRVQPVDMFPHTPHVETVATFVRRR